MDLRQFFMVAALVAAFSIGTVVTPVLAQNETGNATTAGGNVTGGNVTGGNTTATTAAVPATSENGNGEEDGEGGEDELYE
jgi:hypothetical protein